jgi:Flp pilus assembly protein TadD
LHSAGRRFGPLAEDELRNYFRAGMVKSVDRISAPGSVKMRPAGEVALELGETVPEGPPPPELAPPVSTPPPTPAPSVSPAPTPTRPPLDPAAEAERQERAARAVAAMKVDLAVLGAQPRTTKGGGWLLPVVLVGGLVVAMLMGLRILKNMSAQAPRAPQSQGFADTPAQPALAPATTAPRTVEVAGQEEARSANEMLRAKNWPGLVAQARTWTETQPDRLEPWQLLGMGYAQMGDFEAGIDSLRHAQALSPDDPRTRSILADVYLQAGRHGDAVPLYEKVVATSPNDARAWNNYGIALLAVGQNVQAIAALETSVRIDANFKEAWKNLGNAYQANGDARATAAFANAH